MNRDLLRNTFLTSTTVAAAAAVLALAAHATTARAEEPNPSPALDGVQVRLCTDGWDVDARYCSASGEVIATQTSQPRLFDAGPDAEVTLPGSFRFTAVELAEAARYGLPRAVVFGPIYGVYEGEVAGYIWGTLFRDNDAYAGYTGVHTEVHQNYLGDPALGLDTSFTRQYGKEFAFIPHALFNTIPYYVTIYLDQSLPGMQANPGIGTPNTLDGQVWGMQNPRSTDNSRTPIALGQVHPRVDLAHRVPGGHCRGAGRRRRGNGDRV